MKLPILRVEVTANDDATISKCSPSGWGEDASQVNVTGQVMQVTIRHGTEAHFGIRILHDGTLVLTSYKSFIKLVEQNARLEPMMPWKSSRQKIIKKKKAKKRK